MNAGYLREARAVQNLHEKSMELNLHKERVNYAWNSSLNAWRCRSKFVIKMLGLYKNSIAMIIYCWLAFSCIVQTAGSELMLSRGCSFGVYLWSRRCMRKSRPAEPVKSDFPQSTRYESPDAVCGRLSEVPILTFCTIALN